LQLPTRIGPPRDLQGLVDALTSPAYATGIGLLLWGLREEVREVPTEIPVSLWQRIVHWLRSFLPG
jgi:cell division protein FtsA